MNMFLAAASTGLSPEELSAKMHISIPDSLLLSLIGIAIIVAVLALLMGFIYLMSFVMRKAEQSGFSLSGSIKKLFAKKQTVQADNEEEAAPVVTAEQTAPGSAGDIALHDVPPATAAMLMAIVADALQTPVNELRFISIKEIKE